MESALPACSRQAAREGRLLEDDYLHSPGCEDICGAQAGEPGPEDYCRVAGFQRDSSIHLTLSISSLTMTGRVST